MEKIGYKILKANSLPDKQQKRLRNVLREELTEAMIAAVVDNPPEIDLSSVELVLRPNQELSNWSVAEDCGTCGTCATSGGGCGTCGTT